MAFKRKRVIIDNNNPIISYHLQVVLLLHHWQTNFGHSWGHVINDEFKAKVQH